MDYLFDELTQIRKQLVMQQSFINECVAKIDSLISVQINHSRPENTVGIAGNNSYINNQFPAHISTKRGKLLYILSHANEPKLAKEVKAIVKTYGEELPNVDQTLVHLETHGFISSIREGNRKKYFIKK